MADAAAPSQVVLNNSFPYEYAQAITKSDSTTYNPTRALYVGGTGDVAVKMAGDGGTVTFSTVPAGTVLHIRVTQILSTGTSATTIVALW